MAFLYGTKGGIIISIPLLKTKCATEVKTSIIAIAIRPESAASKLLSANFVTTNAIENDTSNTINGFIDTLLNFKKVVSLPLTSSLSIYTIHPFDYPVWFFEKILYCF